MKRWAAIAAVAALALSPAAATEDVVSGLSQDTVEITSNYTGTDIVVFGAIEHPDEQGTDDVVVVVRGPPADMTVREKQWTAGIWINRDQAKLIGMPSYYYIASTRPLAQIAPASTLQSRQLGLDNIAPEQIVSHHDPEPFLQALIRHKLQDKLYGETASGIDLLAPTLFRARVPVPATVPPGAYQAQVYVFRDGNLVSAQSTPLYVNQAGLELRLYNFAHNEPLSYGVATVLMAVLLGWLSALLFRRND